MTERGREQAVSTQLVLLCRFLQQFKCNRAHGVTLELRPSLENLFLDFKAFPLGLIPFWDWTWDPALLLQSHPFFLFYDEKLKMLQTGC